MKRTKIDSSSVAGLLKETIPSGECLIWTRAKGKNGYGHIRVNGEHHSVTRIVYQLQNGVILSNMDVICHACDNPPCINPKHLFVGTQKDNLRDAKTKGRMATAKHGTRSMYVQGCKCRPCKDAESLYARQRKDKNR